MFTADLAYSPFQVFTTELIAEAETVVVDGRRDVCGDPLIHGLVADPDKSFALCVVLKRRPRDHNRCIPRAFGGAVVVVVKAVLPPQHRTPGDARREGPSSPPPSPRVLWSVATILATISSRELFILFLNCLE